MGPSVFATYAGIFFAPIAIPGYIFKQACILKRHRSIPGQSR